MNRVTTVSQHIAAASSRGNVGVPSVKTSSTPVITKEQIIEKRQQGQVWIVIKNNVYDVTDFLDEHPGGAELITDIPEDDFKLMTTEFNDAEHSEEAMEQLQTLFIGVLSTGQTGDISANASMGDEEEEEEEPHQPIVASDPSKPFLGSTQLTLTLLESENLSHDVTVYRFKLPRQTDEFSLMIGKHIVLSFEEMDGKHVSRAYTPVSPMGDCGFIDFLIKRYPNGKMSDHLKNFRPGVDSIQMTGPKGKLGYLGGGNFTIRRKGHNENIRLSHVGMIAGGSGITPMFQIIQAVARDPSDSLKITLLFANKTEEDICLRHPLNEFVRMKRNQIRIIYTLDNPSGEWHGERGFITQAMIKKHLPVPSKDSMIFLCGPPPMIKKACVPALNGLGYPPNSIFKF
jgi:NAD(P)H-flavin reductase/cytochrome b involved in lipid metabolism